MSGKRKQRNRDGWPDYLYETSGYYYWRNPDTKKNFGLGRDLAQAKAQAAEANIHIVGLRDKSRLIDRLTGNDISLWERSDIRDGKLWVEQGKSENTETRGVGMQTRLAIPLTLRMAITTSAGRKIDWTLKDAVARCWSDYVASRYLIHHCRERTHSKPGDPVWKDTVTKGFQRAREATDLKWEGKEPPTFHEIRSLAIRIWKSAKGKDFAQAIAGHKQSSTTDIYTNERGNWVMLKTG